MTIFKRIMMGILTAMVMGTLSAHSEELEFHRFTDTQGNTFRGVLKAYNSKTGVATIRRLDGKTGDAKLSLFSEADRLYIRIWGLKDSFTRGVTITPQQITRKLGEDEASISDATKIIWQTGYALKLRNTSNYDFSEIAMEYCIFYRQGIRKAGEQVYSEGTLYNQELLEPLKSNEERIITTKLTKLYQERGQESLFGAISGSKAEVRGIWIRLTTRLPSGELCVRDFRTSEDDDWKWVDQSIPVGLNLAERPPRTIQDWLAEQRKEK